MLRSRIIPCLLVHHKGLVKTVNFKDPRYVGDPLNAVKIFNEKEVDELMVLDIDATRENRGPDFELIRNLAVECRMPFGYGGGVTTVEEAKKIINLGAEKVAINAMVMKDMSIVEKIGKAVGVQSVVVVIDVAKKGLFKNEYEVYTHNVRRKTGLKLKDYLSRLNQYEIGEIVVNSIDRDGNMTGYDYDLIDMVRSLTDVPLTAVGGAGSYEDIKSLISRYKIIGAAAGSIFVFKGKYKAVLISYPDKKEKNDILSGTLV